jgi:arylsulfatase A-like enzyme
MFWSGSVDQHWSWTIILGLLFSAGSARARDNFLIISLDDVGVDTINVYSRDDLYGHPGEGAGPGPTDTIDQLAAEGVLFRNAYTNPTCSPTRAATLSGRYGFRTGVGTPKQVDLPLSEVLIPEMLGTSWVTAAIGKWHLSPETEITNPNDAGFDHYAGSLAGELDDYYDYTKVVNGSETSNHTVYATTDEADEAIQAIQSFGENPWCVWLAFHAPHRPFHDPPVTLHTQDLSGNPGNTTRYKAMIEAVDTELGRLFHSIPTGVLDDTTIILFGDNGTPSTRTELPFLKHRAKGTVYEGGINVPFIVKSPHIAPADEGSESTALVSTVDIFATLADIGGVAAGTEDSLSLLPYLGDPGLTTQAARPFVYAEKFSPNGFGPYTSHEKAVRDETYKLIWRDGTFEEFFNLNDDPWEQHNLLPLSHLSSGELIAYSNLVAATNNPRVTVPEPLSLVLCAAALISLGVGTSGRRRVGA